MNALDMTIEGSRSYLGMSQDEIKERIEELEAKP